MLDYEHTLEDAAEARVRDFAGDRNAPLRIGEPTRRELATLHRLYGERIAEARTLAGMSAEELANHLGIGKAQALALERGTFGDVPAWLLVRVATITGCRLDFLAGLVDESEHGEAVGLREVIMPALLHADAERAMHALELTRQRRRLDTVERLAGRCRTAANEAQDALQRVVELNPKSWREMRGAARLAGAVTACARAAKRAHMVDGA